MKSMLALLLALTMAAPAAAYTPQQIETARAVADAAWPGTPCVPVGSDDIEVTADLQGGADSNGEAWVRRDPATGRLIASAETCSIKIRPGLSLVDMCDVVVHEVGHTAGVDHDDLQVNDGIMAARPGLPFPPCVTAFPAPRPTARQLAAGAAMTPVSRCRFVMRRRSRRVYRCGHRLVDVTGTLVLQAATR
jgi:hypothetical protein